MMRIAMWSGPRNLSTAMMYAFGARPDFAVVDEPFYASYLATTGIVHPMQSEILASQPNDPEQVAKTLSGSIPGEKAHFYQKHMTHHMVTGVPRGWMNSVVNVFLIRHPVRVIASYAAKREAPTLDDLGFRQQSDLFDHVRDLGQEPIVIDSTDIRADPDKMLRRLCTALGLTFDPAMLRWRAGGHPDDGAWAPHWYGAVHQSTGFAGPEGPMPELPPRYADLAAGCMSDYNRLRDLALLPD